MVAVFIENANQTDNVPVVTENGWCCHYHSSPVAFEWRGVGPYSKYVIAILDNLIKAHTWTSTANATKTT